MFNYLGEYFQLPWGVFSTTLGSTFNYPGECVQLPSGMCGVCVCVCAAGVCGGVLCVCAGVCFCVCGGVSVCLHVCASVCAMFGEFWPKTFFHVGTVKKIVSGWVYYFVQKPLGMAGGLEKSHVFY